MGHHYYFLIVELNFDYYFENSLVDLKKDYSYYFVDIAGLYFLIC